MNWTEITYTAIYSSIFMTLFVIAEIMYHKMKVPIEITRKFVHMGTGFVCLSFPFFLTTHWSVLFLTLCFVVILLLSMKYRLLKSINDVRRTTRGAFLFPIIIYFMFWIYAIYGQHNFKAVGLENGVYSRFSLGGTIYYFLPILVLTISDPLAALFGKKWSYGKYSIMGNNKTVVGSLAFFISAFVLALLFVIPNCVGWQWGLIICVTIAILSTIVEALSRKGFDNFLIPISVTFCLVLFNQFLIL